MTLARAGLSRVVKARAARGPACGLRTLLNCDTDFRPHDAAAAATMKKNWPGSSLILEKSGDAREPPINNAGNLQMPHPQLACHTRPSADMTGGE